MLRRGFTILELTMCIGIIALLVSLALPSLARSRVEARRLVELSRVRSASALLAQYAGDHREVFPQDAATPQAVPQQLRYALALKRAGLVNDVREIDGPEVARVNGTLHILMTVAFASAPSRMEPGSVVHQETSPASDVRLGDVLFPSAKGALLWAWDRDRVIELSPWCCVLPASPGAVAFADSSAAFRRWTDGLDGQPLIVEQWVGYPVLTTWYGSRGRDR
ncbi:MAG: type II secretion system protein [Planctomycetota bacterium]|nr:type II secretion system protein [Planctomycetota bacterium]